MFREAPAGRRLAGRTRQIADGGDRVLEVRLPQRAIVWLLSAIGAAIVLLHLAITVVRSVLDWDFVGRDSVYTVFGMWAESSVSGWFSATLLLIGAALLALIATAKRATGDRFTRHWALLAVILLLLAIDDAADVHGQLSAVMHVVFDTDGYLLYAWIVPGALFALAVGLGYLRFLRALPAAYRWRFLLSGALFSVSAIALEALEARHDSEHGTETMTYKLLVTVEETVEMGALIFFVATLLRYLSGLAPTVALRLTR